MKLEVVKLPRITSPHLCHRGTPARDSVELPRCSDDPRLQAPPSSYLNIQARVARLDRGRLQESSYRIQYRTLLNHESYQEVRQTPSPSSQAAATPKSHPTKPAIRVAPSRSPAVSPQWPITTHPFQSTSREKRPRYTVTVCFLPTNGANGAAHSKQSTQQATLVKWYHLCFPSLQGGRNRIGFGFDSRTSHIVLFIFAPLYFWNLLIFSRSILSWRSVTAPKPLSCQKYLHCLFHLQL